jgi:hypothetical protein
MESTEQKILKYKCNAHDKVVIYGMCVCLSVRFLELKKKELFVAQH